MYESIAAQVKNQQLINEFGGGENADLLGLPIWKELKEISNDETAINTIKEQLKNNNNNATSMATLSKEPLANYFIANYFKSNASKFINEESPLLFRQYLSAKIFENRFKEINKDSFTVLRILGRGAFGNVNACKKKDTGKLYAMKELDIRRIQETNQISFVWDERNFLACMDGNFVSNLRYSFMDNSEGKLYLIMDLLTGGDLAHHLSHDYQFEEERVKFYTAQMILGLEHIHLKDIVYRDMKLGNVLLDDIGYCKITDLGLAIKTVDENGVKIKLTEYAGTPGYIAPEVILSDANDNENEGYDQMADWFSLGCVIYRLLTGNRPFNGETAAELDLSVLNDEARFLDEDGDEFLMSKECKDFVEKLLIKDPKNRIGANGMNEIKNHSWFDDISFEDINNRTVEAEFVPDKDEIYAEAAKEIGQVKENEKFESVEIEKELNEKLLVEFPLVNDNSIQVEIVSILSKIVKQREAKNKGCDMSDMKTDEDVLFAFPDPDEVEKMKENEEKKQTD